MKTLSYSDVRRGLLLQGTPERTVEEFIQHYAANPLIWKCFEKFTIEAIVKGKKIGAKAIMERVRWEAEVEKGEDWKCNNNWTAYYARVFAMKYPEHADFFEFRAVEGLKAA